MYNVVQYIQKLMHYFSESAQTCHALFESVAQTILFHWTNIHILPARLQTKCHIVQMLRLINYCYIEHNHLLL